jgi:hypothetical protein
MQVMRLKLLTFTFLITSACFAQTDAKLTAKLQDAVKGFNGQVGIYVQNLKTGKTAAINADTLFPTAIRTVSNTEFFTAFFSLTFKASVSYIFENKYLPLTLNNKSPAYRSCYPYKGALLLTPRFIVSRT